MSFCDNKKYNSAISTLILILVIVVGVTALTSNVISICRSFCDKPKVERSYPQFEKLNEYIKNSGTLSDNEVLELIIRNQEAISEDRDNILADARQNTNDSIEKMTAELNFWVAIIAILGVLIPIALTFKSGQENKGLIESYITQSRDNDKQYRESLNFRVSQWDESVNDNRVEYNRLKKDIEDLERQLKIEMNLNSIASVRHTRLLEVNSDLRRVYHNFVADSVQEYIQQFEDVLQDRHKIRDRELRWKLVKITLQLYDVIRNLSLNQSGHTRPRYLDKAEEAVRQLLDVLIGSIIDARLVSERFREVRCHLRQILERIEEG